MTIIKHKREDEIDLDGIDVLVRQYQAVQKRIDAGDYSDGTFGFTYEECGIQLRERQNQMRHVFDMLNVDYTQEIK